MCLIFAYMRESLITQSVHLLFVSSLCFFGLGVSELAPRYGRAHVACRGRCSTLGIVGKTSPFKRRKSPEARVQISVGILLFLRIADLPGSDPLPIEQSDHARPARTNRSYQFTAPTSTPLACKRT